MRQEAEEHYRAILRDHPGDLRASVNLATREFQRGDAAAGAARLRSAMEQHRRSALPRMALAAHRLRSGRDDPSDLRQAVELLEEAQRLDPANVDAKRLAQQPRDKERWLRRALYIHPDLFRAHLRISEVLDELGNLEGATTHLWRARQLENPYRPGLTPEEYRRRLRDLYRRLAESEGGAAGPGDRSPEGRTPE